MLDLIGSLSGFLKLNTISIDNNIFRLHYKATVIVLLAASIIVTQKQYFGDPIDCIVDGVDQDIMDTYCWIHSTYSLLDKYDETRLYEENSVGLPKYRGDVPFQGLGQKCTQEGCKKIRYHSYYQWVTFFLYFQAILFYIPRYMWKLWEGGKIKMLVSELHRPIIDDDERKDRKNLLINYFTLNIHRHTVYAYKFIFCEVLNFVNVIGQIYLTDLFLGYEFRTYGTKVLSMTEETWMLRRDPMSFVFPRAAACDFYYSGPSGSLQSKNGLCLLPVNMFNEKIFIFLWFWFIIVATITGIGLIYRILTFFAMSRQILLRTRTQLVNLEDVQLVSSKCELGDWFLLYQLAKNMDPIFYRDFFQELCLALQGKREKNT